MSQCIYAADIGLIRDTDVYQAYISLEPPIAINLNCLKNENITTLEVLTVPKLWSMSWKAEYLRLLVKLRSYLLFVVGVTLMPWFAKGMESSHESNVNNIKKSCKLAQLDGYKGRSHGGLQQGEVVSDSQSMSETFCTPIIPSWNNSPIRGLAN